MLSSLVLTVALPDLVLKTRDYHHAETNEIEESILMGAVLFQTMEAIDDALQLPDAHAVDVLAMEDAIMNLLGLVAKPLDMKGCIFQQTLCQLLDAPVPGIRQLKLKLDVELLGRLSAVV
jgi:hypothetical protein